MKDPVLIKTLIYFAIFVAVTVYLAWEGKEEKKK